MELAYVVAAALLPLALGVLVAWPLWMRRVSDEIGSIAGTFVVLACDLGFVVREFGDVLAASRQCLSAHVICRFEPAEFTRYAIFAGLAMVQVCALFLISGHVENRLRRADARTPEV